MSLTDTQAGILQATAVIGTLLSQALLYPAAWFIGGAAKFVSAIH